MCAPYEVRDVIAASWTGPMHEFKPLYGTTLGLAHIWGMPVAILAGVLLESALKGAHFIELGLPAPHSAAVPRTSPASWWAVNTGEKPAGVRQGRRQAGDGGGDRDRPRPRS